ncbi:MAG: carboxypeptidase-like regulatory domain-containing protein, partial [Candidatus Latescibacterota bacterium]
MLVSSETAQIGFYEEWANSNSSGAFTVYGLPVGRYRATATAPGHVNQNHDHTTVCGAETIFKVNAGATVRGVDFSLERGASVAGRIVDAATGAPLAGINVCGNAVDQCDVWGCSDYTGPDGRYLLNGYFPTGTCNVGINAWWQETPYIPESGGTRTVSVRAPDTTAAVDFRLTRGGAIAGRVLSTSGSPLEDIAVSAWRDGVGNRVVPTGNDGRFLLQGLPPGRDYVAVTNYLDPSAYHWTYYPNAPRQSDAATVAVSPPDTTSGVDLTLVPVVVDSVRNEFLRVAVSDRYPGSNMAVATSGGSPATTADDGKDLLFGYPSPHTSFTTVRIDNRNYRFGSADGDLVVAPHVVGGGRAVERVWAIGDVRVTQTVSLVRSTWSERQDEDTAELRYTLVNTGPRTHRVGLRILLDTMLGANDGAPIKTYSDYRETERVFVRDREPGIPPWWKAMEGDPGNPVFEAQGALSEGEATPPDTLVVGAWSELSETTWQYRVDPDRLVTRDSAVAMWWNSRPVAAGDTLRLLTYYGLGEAEVDTLPPYCAGRLPTPNSTEVPAAMPIVVRLRDRPESTAQKGVDRTSIRMWVNGDSVAPAIASEADSASRGFLLTYASPAPDRHGNGFRCNQTVTVEVEARDLAWVPNVMHRTDSTATYSFQRASDTLAPRVVDQYPASGAREVPLDASVWVTLRDDVAGVMPDSIAMSVDGVPVAARRARNGGDWLVQYTPAAPLRWNQAVRVAVRAQDWAWPPNVMAPHVFSFTAMADTVAPVVTRQFPAPYSEDAV